MNLDEIKYSIKNLYARKTRSGLTVLSILIGIMAIYTLVSFGVGLQVYIDEVAAEAGVDKLFVQAKGVGAPGTDENFQITQDDVDFIEKVKGVDEVSGVYFKPIEVEKDKTLKFVWGAGMDAEKIDFVEELFTVSVERGRTLKKGDVSKVVLGYNHQLPDKIFERPIQLGEKITINDHQFEVVGFYEELGNPSDDANMYFTYEGFELIFPENKDEFGWAAVRAKTNVDTQVLAERVEEKLRKFKDQEEGKEDFFVQTFEDALATFTNIITVLNTILVLIALVSLLVASVNTMNTMYTAVIERTKEIGIMKAIGARNSDIMLIFIFEAGLLGLIGGAMGVFLGFLISSAGGQIAAQSGFALLRPVFPLGLTLGCIFFSFLIGALSGVLPAKQAARLRPVDALRYE